MHGNPLQRETVGLLTVAGALAVLLVAWPAQANYVDWWEVRREVVEKLADRDVIEWSNALAGQIEEADRRALFTALDVFYRAGHTQRVPAVVRRLCRLELQWWDKDYLSDSLIRFQLWDSLRIFLEACPDSRPSNFLQYLFHWWETGDRVELEAWLKRRYEADWRTWHRDYFWVLSERKKLAPLVERLVAEIRNEPTDGQLAFKYLAAVEMVAREIPSSEPLPDIGWLGDVARPKFAVDAYDLGHTLAYKTHHEQAIALFDHSLTRPITERDLNAAMWRCSMLPSGVEHRKLVRRWTKAELAASCKAAGRLDRAQKLVEELLGPEAKLDDLAMVRFAGQTQLASGQRVIESRIKKAEEENKDSVQYWLRRASYYTGRKEHKQADEAFQRALALPPDDNRRIAVGEYVRFLAERQHRYDDAAGLSRRELRRIAPNYDVVSSLVWWLLKLDSGGQATFDSDDPLLWQFLADRQTYDTQEESVLEAFYGKMQARGGKESFCVKAEKLAGPDTDPTRRYVIGKVLLKAGRARRALPLLEDAYRRWPHPEMRGHVTRPLLQAYHKTGDWESAEKMLRKVRSDLHLSEVNSWYVDFAVLAARSGAKDGALRLWRQRANLELVDREGMDKLLNAGMEGPLRAFYSGLAKRDPDNRAVAAALAARE